MNKRIAVVSILVLSVVAVVALFLNGEYKIKQMTEAKIEAQYADNPVMLYLTVGIKECGGYDTRYKGEHSGAVRLEGDDLTKAIGYLSTHWKDITVVLYINAPEANEERRGQPALLPLRKENGEYCALPIAGSYSLPPFLEFEKKYQEQIQ